MRVIKQSLLETKTDGARVSYRELAGTATERVSYETEGLGAGSVWIETDTGKVYVYDESGGDWTEIGGGN